jgi:lantibiotic modifying enzyme
MTLLSGHGEWTGFDLMSGRAGALVALLALGRFWPSDAVWEFAARLADDIVSHARMTERGCSWSTLGEARQPDLTGYLHGTAGIAQALLELFALVGERRYRETAFGAFAYERSWFEQRRGNWADLRRHRHGAECANGPIPWASATGWCHGAPGISLSRLRAYRLTSDPKFKEEALLGLETTKRSVEEVVGMEHGSMSLCHGLAGNLEVLLVGDACLGTRFASTDLVARVVAAAASCARAIQQGRPSTELPGHPPGVMLGFSGIGYFCLRVRDPNIPGMLFIEPERLDSHSDSGLGTQR